jgi:flagellar hook-associated protein 3 FlgL
MRITNNVISRNALTGLQRALQQVDAAHHRSTTGLRVEKASDDPSATTAIMVSGSSLRAIDQYQRNINAATARSNAEENALDTLTHIIERAKELAISQSNSTADAQTRLVAKAEIDQLLQQAVQLGNTQLAGEYLFGGDQSNVPPFQGAAPPFAATPPTGTRRTEISSALYVKSNHNGTEVFLNSGAFASLNELSVALGANDQAGILTSISSIDTTHSSLQVLIGETGAQSSQLEVAGQNLKALDTSLRAFKSNLQDADLETAVTELVSKQTAYQAALLATSKVMGLNLAEYLR